MASNDPGPFFGRINSLFGGVPHNQQFSLTTFNPPAGAFTHGSVQNDAAIDLNLDSMMNDFVDVLAPFFTSGFSFNNWQIFSKPTPSDLPVPVEGNIFTGKVGTASPGFAEVATQQTIVWRTTGFKLFKIVLVDYVEDVSFEKITVLPGSGPLFDLDSFLRGAFTGIIGRDGNFPAVFVAATKTLNEKQRKIRRQT
jgi:hypothetical protein